MTTLNPRHSRGTGEGDAGQETKPPQDDASGAHGTPLELGSTGWRHTLMRIGKEFSADRCAMTAGRPYDARPATPRQHHSQACRGEGRGEQPPRQRHGHYESVP